MALTLVTSDLIHGLDYSKLTGTIPTWNQNTTGSAATLTTARNIGGVSFNGSAAINLPGVNAAGNQNTSGTAAGLSATLVVGSGGTGVTSITALKNVLDDETWTFANKITSDAGIDIDNFNIDGNTISLSSGNMVLGTASAASALTISDYGLLTMTAGSSSNPRLIFAGADVSGAHFIQINRGDSSMQFHVNGDYRATISSGGIVGIGSTGIFAGTNAILNLQGIGIALKNDKNGSNNNWSYIQNTGTGSNSDINFYTGNNSSALNLSHSGAATFSSNVLIASGEYLSWGTIGATSIEGSTASNKIQFRTGSGNRMIINNTGVGIGTTTLVSTAQLTVVGNYHTDFIRNYYGSDRGYLLRFGANTASSGYVIGSQIAGSLANNDADGSLEFYTKSSGTLAERMRIGSLTNTLVLKGTGTTGGNYLQFQNSSSTVQGYVGYGSSGSNTLYIAQQSANSDIIMYNGGQSRLTIESGGAATFGGTVTSTSGFLGNATTSSRFKSTAQGSTTYTNANLLYTGIHMNYYGSGYVSNAASIGYGTVISFGGSNGGVAGSLQLQAVLTHNTSTAATNSLYYRIGNNLGYSNDWRAFTYTSVSDYRLKENIKPMNSVIDRIKSMNAVSFNFINEPDKEVEGFIAHEVQEIIPEAVLNEKDKVGSNGTPMYQSIDYSRITPFLIKAIQEQQAQIELLKQEVESLKQ